MTPKPEKKHTIIYGKEKISFTINYSPRTQLAINVHPDCKVTVTAPETRSESEIIKRVYRKAAWILKQTRYFSQFHPLPKQKEYVSGETHLYLGRQYRLKIILGKENNVKLKGKNFFVGLSNKENTSLVKKLLESWYMNRAKDIFVSKTQQCLKKAPLLQMPPPKIIIRRMAKRWGSCTETGHILINVELIKTPIDCIEYLIMHELCHLRIHNHGAAYYSLLKKCMPDWEHRKKRLDSFII